MNTIERATEMLLKANANLVAELSLCVEEKFEKYEIETQEVEEIVKRIVYGNRDTVTIESYARVGFINAEICFETGAVCYKVEPELGSVCKRVAASVELHKEMIKLFNLTAELIELKDSVNKVMEENNG